jgi:hypothetical protein
MEMMQEQVSMCLYRSSLSNSPKITMAYGEKIFKLQLRITEKSTPTCAQFRDLIFNKLKFLQSLDLVKLPSIMIDG